MKEQLASAHDRSKKQYDKGVSGEKITVGDQVYLFIPAVKQGRTKNWLFLGGDLILLLTVLMVH